MREGEIEEGGGEAGRIECDTNFRWQTFLVEI